ncbi:MAG: hypothetical protein D6733_02995 [Methanobacteriota archaeon]|nr:MAG: hypothetical protein D6733_02995 [Euryarchaeota archaeon]
MDEKTPRFSPDLIPEGFIARGETRLFPNLFPFARYHAVATLTRSHFLRTGEFKARQIEDAFSAGVDFLERVHNRDTGARFPAIGWNHLSPSGASIVHPHLQIIMDSRPTYLTGLVLEGCRRYIEERGSSYWADLVREERMLGERYIGSLGRITFLAAYAPFGNGEVLAVFDGRSSLSELDRGDLSQLSRGVVRILRGYAAMGVESFNLSTFSGPMEGAAEGFSLHIRIIARPLPAPYHTSDTGFMETLHLEKIVEMLPEDVASAMKKGF